MAAWNLAYVARFSETPPDPVVTVGPVWRELVTYLGDTLGTDTALVTCVDTVQEAVEEIIRRIPTS